MAAVNITAVHKWFGSTQVIRGVDIAIAEASSAFWSALRGAASRHFCE